MQGYIDTNVLWADRSNDLAFYDSPVDCEHRRIWTCHALLDWKDRIRSYRRTCRSHHPTRSYGSVERGSILRYGRMSKNLHKGIRRYSLGNGSKSVSCISESDSALRRRSVRRHRTILMGISAIVLCIHTYRIDRSFHSAFDLWRCDSWGNVCGYDFSLCCKG